MNIKERARQLKIDIPAVFLSLKDGRTSIFVKILASITVAYALSPIDLIPDFIPVLGFLDDVIILPGLIAITIKLIPKDIWEDNKVKAKGMWENGRPQKWYYAIPVILIWALLVYIIVIKIIN